MSVRVAAYAKLNLSLRVLGRRTDGYHEIDSEVQTIDLADRLTIDLAATGVLVENDLALEGPDLVERAAVALLRRKERDRGVQIRVEKRIPIGAGLGGGSSDAAAVLRALDRLLSPELPFDVLCAIGAEIGSDVPLFLHGGRARIGGRGERVQRLPRPTAEHFVVLVPPIHCATAAIYARWDELSAATGPPRASEPKPGENDLLRPALDVHPEIVPYHDAMRSLGAGYHGMSGSGSSFYSAFAERALAERAAAVLESRFDAADVFVCRPTDVGHRTLEAP